MAEHCVALLMVVDLAEVMVESMVAACAPFGCFDGRESEWVQAWLGKDGLS